MLNSGGIMRREDIEKYLKEDVVCKGIKITNKEDVLNHIERLLELFQYIDPSERLYIRYYIMGYAAGVQSRS